MGFIGDVASSIGSLGKSVIGGASKALNSDAGRLLTAFATTGTGGVGADPLFNILRTGAQIGGSFLANSGQPDAPVFGQGNQPARGFTPENVAISNPLFGTTQNIAGGKVTADTIFTPEGERLKGLFEAIRLQDADAFAGFDRQGQVTEQQALLRSILEPTINTERNALLDSLNAQTGGVATSPGGQAALANFAQQASSLKAQQDLAAFDRATGEQDRLRGFRDESLRTLAEFQNIGAGQATAAREVSSDIESANRAVAKENFDTQGAAAAAESDFLTDIFRGVVGGIGDIFGGGGGTSRTPDIVSQSFNLFGGGGTSGRSPFSSQRSLFNFGGFG